MVKKHTSKSVERISVQCDNVIVLMLSRTLLGTEDDCLYLATYVPPSGSPFYHSADSNRHIAEVEKCICDLLEEFSDVNIICNGDFNARTDNYQVNQDLYRIMRMTWLIRQRCWSAVETRKTAR